MNLELTTVRYDGRIYDLGQQDFKSSKFKRIKFMEIFPEDVPEDAKISNFLLLSSFNIAKHLLTSDIVNYEHSTVDELF